MKSKYPHKAPVCATWDKISAGVCVHFRWWLRRERKFMTNKC